MEESSGLYPKLKEGETIGYHGREGVVQEVFNSDVLVYFPDIDEEEMLDYYEVWEQEYGE